MGTDGSGSMTSMSLNKSTLAELQALMTGFWLTDLANFSAFFYQQMSDINWLGFLSQNPFADDPIKTYLWVTVSSERSYESHKQKLFFYIQHFLLTAA